MQTNEATDGAMMLGDNFQRARIEHYLQRVEEYIQMRRYHTAGQALAKVFALDPKNRAGHSLEKRIEFILTTLSANGDVNHANDGVPGEQSWKKQRRNELVMIVDQDERLLLTLTENLNRHGYDVIAAGSFEEAITTLSSVRPALLISEVNFANGPVGFDLYLWIRTNAGLQDIPFLFLATKVDRETLIAGKRLGVDDFIVKPLDSDVVVASVINCLGRNKKPRITL